MLAKIARLFKKKLVLVLIFLFFVMTLAFCLAFVWQEKVFLLEDLSFSRRVYDRQGQLLRLTLSADEKYRIKVSLNELNSKTIASSLEYEDKYFYSHFGVNPLALLKAFWHSYVLKDQYMGASTITMQVARLKYKLETRDIKGKLRQIYLALLLEYHYSKDEILEAYFNLAPYGGNIEGIAAAAQIYFQKMPSRLTDEEILALSIIPQNPNKRKMINQSPRANLASRLSTKAQGQELKVYTLADLPFKAPHVVNLVLKNSSEQSISTTLDSNLQSKIEQDIARFVARLRNYKVYNAAAMLVHIPSHEIRALVGSADYFNSEISGQINGTTIKRSPGSTLKPFIYGLALDQSLIHPQTLLLDSPSSFANYEPENFDQRFRGPIHAREALHSSRNIPAIYLANRLQNPNLYEFLQKAQITFEQNADYYGLALVLGGAELSMWDLLTLYSSLANSGLYQELKLDQAQKNKSSYSLLTPEAAFITLDMLQDPQNKVKLPNQSLPIYYKTGTSNAFRDAWTVGIFGQYALAVWLGNFDNSSNHLFIGGEIALPLFMDLVQTVARSVRLENIVTPEHLRLQKIEFCKLTGDTDLSLCQDTVEDWFIPGKSPISQSGVLQRVLIDKASGLRACIRDPQKNDEVIMENWSTEILNLFRQAGINKKSIPEWLPECSQQNVFKPEILSPREQVLYQYSLQNPERSRIILKANVDAKNNYVYWFVDGSFLAKIKSNEDYSFLPTKDKHTVKLMDEQGNSHSVKINIEQVP